MLATSYGGLFAITSDAISFPSVIAPVVLSVSGCSSFDPLTNVTSECPTKGNVTLTIEATNYAEPVQVQVNGADCPVIRPIKPRFLQCVLPAGAGFLQNVVVVSAEGE